jgi:SH3-like domain-containing protein
MLFFFPRRIAITQTGLRAAFAALLLPLLALAACSVHKHPVYVYVSAQQAFLHDRVAAVSNRVAEVKNGQELEVIEHGKRFLHVRTEKNEIGWIEEHAVADEKLYQQFQKLAADHKNDPNIATATVRDDVYLHVKPGRETEHLYLLPGNVKVQLLHRAIAPKDAPPPAPKATANPVGTAQPSAAPPATIATKPANPALPAMQPVQQILEDWWMVRDPNGHTGWLLAGRVDVDVPDEIGIFAEGQRIVGSYIIAKVNDPKSTVPDHMVPEYLTLMSPPKTGLPYDFDQVRVFTWSVQRHRYETAYRIHPISGYLPMTLGSEPAPEHKPTQKELAREQARIAQHKEPEKKPAGPVYAPTFTFQVANGTDITIDPETGMTRPTSLRTVQFQMVDTRVERIGADRGPIPLMHLPGDKTKSKNSKSAAKPAKTHHHH